MSTPDSVFNERSSIFEQFRERYHQFHFKDFSEENEKTQPTQSSKTFTPPEDQNIVKDHDNNDVPKT